MASSSLYLVDEVDAIDRAVLERWVRDAGGTSSDLVVVPDVRNASSSAMSDFARRLREAGDPTLTPLRVAWLSKGRDDRQTPRVRDLLFGDPLHPPRWRKEWLRRTARDRVRVIVADAAPLSELRERFSNTGGDPDDTVAFAAFVARQAVLAAERAEYRLLGAQYKVPRLVREEIEASPEFHARAQQLAAELGRDPNEVWADVQKSLDEMVTGYSRFLLDLMARLGQFITRPGYGDEIDYDRSQTERVREELRRHPAVILPSHKSNFDAAIIPVVMHENGLPPVHTFAGINMAFWPIGPVMRRAGRIFIRRDVKSDPVYRWVLREYLAYLVEKRFTLEWYIEGTRSRTGKLGPPKMGLLRYIVDAVRDGRTDDVAMVPVSIMYDELHEVREYAREVRGAPKEAESLGWMLRTLRAERAHRGGRIYVRFGEPLSLRAALRPDATQEEADLELQKLAFEVSTRINAVTPITATSLVCLVLLSVRGRAVTLNELHQSVNRLLAHLRKRRLPLAASAEKLDMVEGLRSVLGSLATNKTIETYDRGTEPVYSVAPGQHHAAAFYRNTIIHHFVTGAIGELSLVYAALKFDFFFEQRDAFRNALATELNERLPGWENQLIEGIHPNELLEQLRPLSSFGVLRPFVEAYLIVADTLLREPTVAAVDDKAFIAKCLAVGDQYVRQQRVRSPSAVSKPLLATALKLAENRELTRPAPGLEERREAFAAELGEVARHIDVVEQQAYAAAGGSLTAVAWRSEA